MTAVAFGVDGNGRPLLASGSVNDYTVLLWDPATGRQVGPILGGGLPGYSATVTSNATAVAFGVDGNGRPLLASAGGYLRLWDPATGQPVGDPLAGRTGAVAFGVDGDGRPLLASAGDDLRVRLWDPTTGTTIVTLLRRTIPTAVAAQGTHLAIADPEGVTVVEVMDVPDRSFPLSGTPTIGSRGELST